MIFPGYSLAFRGVYGMMLEGDKNQYPFYVGGYNSIRGYDLWTMSGDRMFLMNLELRVPFIADWIIGVPFLIRMPTIWGTVFFDAGSAWNDGQLWTLSETRTKMRRAPSRLQERDPFPLWPVTRSRERSPRTSTRPSR